MEQGLVEKTDIDEAVSAEARREMEGYGVRGNAIALKDNQYARRHSRFSQPGGHRQEEAQANLIRRREERAATRSLLNSARLIEENPLLVRLKELEALEKIADKVEKITLLVGLNTLLDGTVTLRAE